METIIKNKKIAIIIAIIVVLGTILLGAYHQSVSRYSSKIAVQIDMLKNCLKTILHHKIMLMIMVNGLYCLKMRITSQIYFK